MNWAEAMQLTVIGLLLFGLGLYLGALWGLSLANRILDELLGTP